MKVLSPCFIIFAIFLFLKLAGIGICATWSWWAVFSPLWVPFIAWVMLFILICVFRACVEVFK